MTLHTISTQQFADIIGETNQSLAAESQQAIENKLMQYETISTEKQAQLKQNIITELQQNKFDHTNDEDQQQRWEKRWAENKTAFLSELANSNISEVLIPNYMHYNDWPIRLSGEFVQPVSDKLLYHLVNALRLHLYATYLQDFEHIYELGCGSGHNLYACHRLFPDKHVTGLDWSAEAVALINLFAEKQQIASHLSAKVFNMQAPPKDFILAPQSAVITHGSFEQLGENFQPIVNFLLEQKVACCIQVEPLNESYDATEPFDKLALDFTAQRGYLKNYYPYLKTLEQQGQINIEKLQKVKFGSFYHDGFSYVVWRIIS